MSEYLPDRWVVLEFTKDDVTVRKLFGGWYGGYLGSDSWKLNSGITNIRIDDGKYEFDGYSGSTYICHKNSHGMSNYQYEIFENWLKQAEKIEGYKITEIALEDIVIS